MQVVHRLSTLTKWTLLASVVFALSGQTAFAKVKRQPYYKKFKYAKEEFIPKPRYWGGLEYMSMWEQNGPVGVPLVTINSDATLTGAMGETGTDIIYGKGSGQDLNYYNSNGGRLTLGAWMDDYQTYGVEFSGFLLQKVYTNFDVSSPGGEFPIVSIPIFQTQPPSPGEAAIFANGLPNKISVNTSSQLWGAELNFVYNLSEIARYPVEALIGFRYLSLDESLSLNDTIYDTATPVGALITNGFASYNDSFQTQNNFYGLALGLRSKILARNGFTLDVSLKLALGENAELIDVDGESIVYNSALGLPTGVYGAGIFAQPSNIGSFTHNTFAVLPEAQIKMGYMIAPNVHPYISYDVLYMNRVVRPGEQINRNINTSENPAIAGATVVTGALSPGKPGFHNTSFWMQGLTVGLEVSL